MTTVVPVKLTQSENDLVDWLVAKLHLESRSQALRLGMIELARLNGIRAAELERVREQRRTNKPRRSAKYARLLGPRRVGEGGGELDV